MAFRDRLRLLEEPHADGERFDEVAHFAEGLSDKFLQCRDFGHSWRPWHARWHDEGFYERAFLCHRCKAERWQTLSRFGEVLGGHYRYPDGYQHTGLGRIVQAGRDALRLESVLRAVGPPSSERQGA